jgi:hypothetical protein
MGVLADVTNAASIPFINTWGRADLRWQWNDAFSPRDFSMTVVQSTAPGQPFHLVCQWS